MGLTESTRFAVLGLAVDGPTHAYAIAEEIGRWQLDAAVVPDRRAIYHAVRWLDQNGWLASAEEQGIAMSGGTVAVGAPPRKPVVATPKGIGRFTDWLGSPITATEEIVWRVGAARRSDFPDLIRVLQAAEMRWIERLRDEAVPNAAARQPSWPSTRLMTLATMRTTRLAGEASLIRETRILLSRLHDETKARS
jgi:DNA-binding PadR family transcriptional regulator